MARSNKEVIHRWVEAINRGRLDFLDEIVKPDFVRHCEATPGVDVRSLEDFKTFDHQTREIFGGLAIKNEMLVAEGDKVAFWGSLGATQKGAWARFPATGKRFESDISGVFRLEDGMIAELWITWDNLSGLMQLGHLSPKD